MYKIPFFAHITNIGIHLDLKELGANRNMIAYLRYKSGKNSGRTFAKILTRIRCLGIAALGSSLKKKVSQGHRP